MCLIDAWKANDQLCGTKHGNLPREIIRKCSCGLYSCVSWKLSCPPLVSWSLQFVPKVFAVHLKMTTCWNQNEFEIVSSCLKYYFCDKYGSSGSFKPRSSISTSYVEILLIKKDVEELLHNHVGYQSHKAITTLCHTSNDLLYWPCASTSRCKLTSPSCRLQISCIEQLDG